MSHSQDVIARAEHIVRQSQALRQRALERRENQRALMEQASSGVRQLHFVFHQPRKDEKTH